MAFPYGNNPYYQSQPMFPQPNGNIYMIQNSLEVANVPAGAGVTAALCTSESLLYLKSMQNGIPTFLAYKLTPYTDGPKTTAIQSENEMESRLAALEKQITTILTVLGGKRNDEPISTAPTTTAATTDWG